MRFKNLEGNPERESPKKTIFVSGGLEQLQMVSEPDTGLLQMVSEPDTRQCASEDAEPRRREDTKCVPH